MIRSGEHALWDAHLAELAAQEPIQELIAMFVPAARAFAQLGQQLGQSFAEAVSAMRRVADAWPR